MKRNAELVELAKGLYVRDQLTFKEIGHRLGVNERTVRTWKDREEGRWDKDRELYLDSKRGFHEELYEFSRELIRSIRSALKDGEKVEQSRLNCIARILPLILKPKDYEEAAKARKQAEEDAASADLASIIASAMELGGSDE